jgi:hypothetical protein
MRNAMMQYRDDDFGGVGWVVKTARMTVPEINRAIRDDGFPVPSGNVAPGKELWAKSEVEAWLRARGKAVGCVWRSESR